MNSRRKLETILQSRFDFRMVALCGFLGVVSGRIVIIMIDQSRQIFQLGFNFQLAFHCTPQRLAIAEHFKPTRPTHCATFCDDCKFKVVTCQPVASPY